MFPAKTSSGIATETSEDNIGNSQMEHITDQGTILMVLISDLLIIISVTLILLVARSLADRRPEESASIMRLVCVISPIIVIVFGVLAETIIILKILWTVGYI